jgi:hypothetical protein
MPTKNGSDSRKLEQDADAAEPAAPEGRHTGTGWPAHSCYDDAAARMKLREVPAGAPNEGCVYTGKAFHKWSLSFIDPRPSGYKDLERKCTDCGARQHADAVPDHETRELPKALWCLGDWKWRPGGLEP